MPHKPSRRGFTWIELLAILVVISVLLGLLIPAIQAARENSRKQACLNNLKQIGLAMHSYHDSFKKFPNSAGVVGTNPASAGECSFLFKLLPFLDYNQEVYALSPDWRTASKLDPFTNSDPAFIRLKNLQIPFLICPANPNKTYEDPVNKKIAFTNYKAMGATCMESLMLCVDPDSPPPYGDKTKHPDGAIFPGDKGISISRDIMDGTAYTIMVAETIDDLKSSWIAGSDVTQVGMPKAEYYQQWHGSFWIPLDYTGGYYEYAGPAIRAMRTYNAFDFRPGYADAGTYPSGVGRTPAYGPSSNHPGFVNHLYCDGSVKSIGKDVDYAAYFIFITRDNNDPGAGNDPFF